MSPATKYKQLGTENLDATRFNVLPFLNHVASLQTIKYLILTVFTRQTNNFLNFFAFSIIIQ